MRPLRGKCRVLTAAPPGKSPLLSFYNGCVPSLLIIHIAHVLSPCPVPPCLSTLLIISPSRCLVSLSAATFLPPVIKWLSPINFPFCSSLAASFYPFRCLVSDSFTIYVTCFLFPLPPAHLILCSLLSNTARPLSTPWGYHCCVSKPPGRISAPCYVSLICWLPPDSCGPASGPAATPPSG